MSGDSKSYQKEYPGTQIAYGGKDSESGFVWDLTLISAN